MPEPTLSEYATVLDDALSYISAYAPDFPAEDATTVEKELDWALERVRLLWSEVQDVERRRTLDRVGKELVEARSCFLARDHDAGRKLILSAQERLWEWKDRKRVKVLFVVGPDGEAKKVE